MAPSQPRATSNPCRASIIIPTFNRREDLSQCLDALPEESLVQHNVELTVIDDASSDGTVEMLQSSYAYVHLIVNAENRGPAYSRNRASRDANGSLLLYLDSDGVPEERWLERLLENDDGETILLGCAVDYEGGRVQRLPRRASFLGKSLQCRPERANTGPSCNLGVPRKCFDAVGGFDEEIPHYFEDSDFCIRARKAGFSFRYLPDAIFRHKGSGIMLGEAVRKQEHNSVYAMLKTYDGQPLRLILFTLGNGLWLTARLLLWPCKGRFRDCGRLLAGWGSAYLRYFRRLSTIP